MEKNMPHISIRLMALASAVFLIASFKNPPPPKDKKITAKLEKTAKVVAEQDLETIRKRILNDLLEPAIKSEQIKKIVRTIKPDGSWPGINYKDTTKTGFEHRIHLENMLALAEAYKKPGSEFN
jgi:hypothetical protein